MAIRTLQLWGLYSHCTFSVDLFFLVPHLLLVTMDGWRFIILSVKNGIDWSSSRMNSSYVNNPSWIHGSVCTTGEFVCGWSPARRPFEHKLGFERKERLERWHGEGGERCRGGRGGVGVWFFPSSNELTADGTQQYLCQLREVPPQGGAGGGIGN